MHASLSCMGLGEWLREDVGVALVDDAEVGGLGESASISSTS
jgi:hypothetical protein